MKKILLVIALLGFPVTSFADSDDSYGHSDKYRSYKISDEKKTELFKMLDTNKNNKISFSEFKNIRETVMFMREDKDRNGSLSKKEFFERRRR